MIRKEDVRPVLLEYIHIALYFQTEQSWSHTFGRIFVDNMLSAEYVNRKRFVQKILESCPRNNSALVYKISRISQFGVQV